MKTNLLKYFIVIALFSCSNKESKVSNNIDSNVSDTFTNRMPGKGSDPSTWSDSTLVKDSNGMSGKGSNPANWYEDKGNSK